MKPTRLSLAILQTIRVLMLVSLVFSQFGAALQPAFAAPSKESANQTPVFTETDPVSVTMSKNGTPTAFDLSLHATDADTADTLTWSILTAAGHGTAAASGTGNVKSITYTPDLDYVGEDSFVVQVDDGNGGTATLTVNVTVQEPEATATPTSTATDTPEPSATPTATDTPEPSATPTATDTLEPSATPTATDTPEPSATPTATDTLEPSATPTATDTLEPSATPTATDTLEPSATPTATATPSGPAFTPLSWTGPDCSTGMLLHKVEAVDAGTVTFNLCNPDPAFLSKIALPEFGIYPQAWLASTDGASQRTGEGLSNPVGTGPYKVGDWTKGTVLSLVRNPYYWGAAGLADTLNFKWTTDKPSTLGFLQSGAIDGYSNVPASQFSAISGDADLQLVQNPQLVVGYLGMNSNFPYFSDLRVRQAIAQALDRQHIVDTLYPAGSQVPTHFTPCAIPNGCAGEDWYGQNVAAAQALMAAAGYPSGFTTHLYYRNVARPYQPDVTGLVNEIHNELLANLGINAIPVQLSNSDLLSLANAGKLDGLFILGWGVDYPHMTDWLDWHFGQTSKLFGKPLPDIYNYLNDAHQYADPADAAADYAAANNAIKQNVPMVPLVWPALSSAYRADVTHPQNSPFSADKFALSNPGGRGILNFIQDNEPASLFCADEFDSDSLRICSQINEPLYTYAENGADTQPDLATACTPSSDLKTWTCSLRPNVKFNDGSDLSANDVVATFRMGLDSSSPDHVGNSNSWNAYQSIWGGSNPGSSSNPTFSARLSENQVHGYNWPLGGNVHLHIVKPDGTTYDQDVTSVVAPWDSSQTFTQFSLPGYTLQPGDAIIMSGSSATILGLVGNLAVTGVDQGTDTVSGTADPGSKVRVDVNCGSSTCPARYPTADGSGKWSADFSVAGPGTGQGEDLTITLVPGISGQIYLGDDSGNLTNVLWNVFNPTIDARVNHNTVEAWGWNLHSTLNLRIYSSGVASGDPDYSTSASVDGTAPGGDPRTYVNFMLKGHHTLKAGDLVVIDDGATTKQTKVTGLAFTGMDTTADTLSGTAAAGSKADVWACDNSGCSTRHVTANGSGEWLADFHSPGSESDEQTTIHLSSDVKIDSNQVDEDGDSTMWGQNVPGLHVFVPDQYRVEARNWPDGETLSLTIDRPGSGSPVYHTTAVSGPAPWNPGEIAAVFDLNDPTTGFHYQVGDTITVTDGGFTKSHVVQYITVSSVDAASGVITGTADPGAAVEVDIHIDNQPHRNTTADSSGNWSVTFSEAQGDQAPFTLKPGMDGSARRIDADGDLSRADFHVFDPRIAVVATNNHDHVEVFDWQNGSSLNLKIYASGLESGTPDYTANTTYPNGFWLGGVYDIQPGYLVVVTDGTDKEEVKVSNVTVTSLDAANAVVSGTAEPGVRVDAWIGGYDNANRWVTAGGDGKWSADFKVAGSSPDESRTFTSFTPGMNGGASVYDGINHNYTYDGWKIPNPRFDAWFRDGNIHAYDWPDGTHLVMEVTNPGGNPEFVGSGSADAHANSDGGTDADFWVNGAFEIQPGFLITISGADITRTLVVADLSITSIDPSTDIITGKAGDNQDVWMYLNTKSGTCCRNSKTDATGNWSFDYSKPGPDGEPVEDIGPGSSGTINAHNEQGNNTSLSWSIPNPNFAVRINNDQVQAWEFPLHSTLTLDVYESGVVAPSSDYTTTKTVDGPAPWGDPRNFAEFDLYGSFTLKAGDLVTVGDGTTTKSLLVTNLAFTNMDPLADTVTGSAPADSHVQVWACDNSGNCINRYVTADGSGVWVANWHVPGSQPDEQNTFDLKPGTWVDSSQTDEDNDQTMWGQNIPNPRLIVFVDNSYRVEAYDWPDGDLLTLVVDHPDTLSPIFSTTAKVGPAPWDPKNLVAQFDLSDLVTGYHYQPGDTITVSDAAGLTKSHLVRDITVTSINPATGVISGKAPDGDPVEVDIFENNAPHRNTNADSSGDWSVDFSKSQGDQGAYTLSPGLNGGAIDYVDAPNASRYDWRVLNSRVEASVMYNRIQGRDWVPGETVNLEIGDPVVCSASATFQHNPDNPGDPNDFMAAFDLNNVCAGFALKAGDKVTLSDGAMSRTIYVSPIAVTTIDPSLAIVSGTANPNADVHVWAKTSDNINRYVKADGDGNWSADFKVKGTQGDEQTTLDSIPPGTWGGASEDVNAGSTWVDWYVPNRRVEANVMNNRVQGREWVPGETVTLVINDPPDYQATATFGQNPENPGDPNDQIALFDLNGHYTLKPGDKVTLSDKTMSRSIYVSPIAVTTIDPTLAIVSGTANPNADVHVWANVPGGINRHVKAGGDGNWSADFKVTGSQDDEQTTLDSLAPGTQGGASEDVEAGSTWVDWRVLNPRVEASVMYNRIQGREWVLGETVNLEIGDPVVCSASATFQHNPDNPGDPNDFLAAFDLNNVCTGFTLTAGDKVTMSDGSMSRTIYVSPIAVTTIDPSLAIVSGTANPNADVHVWANVPGGINRHVKADGDGNWSADFKVTGKQGDEQSTLASLAPGTQGGASEDVPEGSTWVDWSLPNPNFDVRANVSQVEAWEWPLNSVLELRIYASGVESGTPNYTATASVDGPTPWGDPRNYAAFDFLNKYTVKPGYLVTVSDGSTTKSTIVTDLAFTQMDPNTDIVTGIASPDSKVEVWTCDNSGCNGRRHVTSDSYGNWQANFAVPGSEPDEQVTVDLQLGSWVDSSQSDQDGDSTMFGANVPDPHITIDVTQNTVEAFGFMIDQPVTLNLYKPVKGPLMALPDKAYTMTAQPSPWDSGISYQLFPIFNDGISLEPGTNIYMVSSNLTFWAHVVPFTAQASVESDIVSGTVATPYAEITVGLDDGRNWTTTADGDGNWSLNLNDYFTLGEGSQGTASFSDGNVTEQIRWYVPWNGGKPGQLRIALGGAPKLDPITSDGNGWSILSQLFETLYHQQADGTLIPAAASGYSVSPDGLTYTVTLRSDGMWWDGTTVTAQDYINGLLHLEDPASNYDLPHVFYPIAGMQAYHEGSGLASDVGLSAPDDTTLVFHLGHPAPYFPGLLAHPNFLPKHPSAEGLMGNGPYLLSEDGPAHYLLEPNPNFRGASGLALKDLAFVVIPFEKMRMQAYKDGNVQVLLDANRYWDKFYTADPALASDLLSQDEPTTFYIGLFVGHSPVSDVNVRKALAAATDRLSLVNNVFDRAFVDPAGALIPPVMPGHRDKDVGISYDPGAAQAFLAAAGYPGGEGFPGLTIVSNFNSFQYMEALAQQWRDNLGIPVKTVYVNQIGAYRGACQANPDTCHYDVYNLGWYADYIDGLNMTKDLIDYVNFGNWSNADFDAGIQSALNDADLSAHLADLQQAEDVMLSGSPALSRPSTSGASTWPGPTLRSAMGCMCHISTPGTASARVLHWTPQTPFRYRQPYPGSS